MKVFNVQSNKHFRQLAAAGFLASGVVASTAFAADPDVSAVVATVASAGVAAAAIGVAVLSMHYGIKLYKWIKGAG
jgi:hypothetical protein